LADRKAERREKRERERERQRVMRFTYVLTMVGE